MDPPAHPTHARVKAVGEDWAELEWRQPARSPPVDGWAVAIQAGGVGGFVWALPHTRCTTTRAVLQGLDAGTWYEFRVTAVNAAGPGPHSVPTRPVVTAMAPQSAPSARELLSAELKDELDYARLRRRILRWDGEFEAMHGSPPTDEHRRDSEAYGEMVRKFGELRATRRGRRGRRRSEEFEMAPLGLASGSGHGPSEGAVEREGKLAGASDDEVRAAAWLEEAERANAESRVLYHFRIVDRCSASLHVADAISDLDEAALEEAVGIFASYDEDLDARLDRAEFAELMGTLEAEEALGGSEDIGADGSDPAERRSLAVSISRHEAKQRWRMSFQQADVGGSGVDLNALLLFLRRRGREAAGDGAAGAGLPRGLRLLGLGGSANAVARATDADLEQATSQFEVAFIDASHEARA